MSFKEESSCAHSLVEVKFQYILYKFDCFCKKEIVMDIFE